MKYIFWTLDHSPHQIALRHWARELWVRLQLSIPCWCNRSCWSLRSSSVVVVRFRQPGGARTELNRKNVRSPELRAYIFSFPYPWRLSLLRLSASLIYPPLRLLLLLFLLPSFPLLCSSRGTSPDQTAYGSSPPPNRWPQPRDPSTNPPHSSTEGRGP